MLEALFTATRRCSRSSTCRTSCSRRVGKPKRTVTPPAVDEALVAGASRRRLTPRMRGGARQVTGKHERCRRASTQAEAEVVTALGDRVPGASAKAGRRRSVDELKKQVVREAIVERRAPHRRPRPRPTSAPITCEVGVLPRTHGSALFTRGETQALVVATLGTSSDEQKIER